MTSMPRPVCLDVSRMPVTRDGVRDFAWPIAAEEIPAVRDRFLAALIPFLKREASRNRQALVLGLMIHVLGEVLSVYKAQATIRRLKAMGRHPVVASDSRLLGAMLDGRVPRPSAVIGMLERGMPAVPGWRRALQLARARMRGGAICRRCPAAVDMKHDIVTVALGEMIQQHAEALGEPVSCVGFDTWFGPLSAEDRPAYGGAPSRNLVDAVIDMARDAFASQGEPLQDNSAAYLRAWIESAATFADRYLARLLARPEIVPRRLWRGTGGHVFARILSHASRELGGEVTGHDHSHGQGMFAGYSDTIIEHPFCDRFMVWTETQRKMAQRNLKPELAMPGAPPTIQVVPGTFRPKIVDEADAAPAPKSTPNTIMYVGTLYNDEFAPMTPLIPDIVLVDWEARLIAQLRDWGFDVIVKPHPESRFATPAAYEDLLGARIVHGRFEDVYKQADLVLFGQPNCTPFFGALGTRQPIVVADTGMHFWQPEAAEMLARRCGVVSCGRDAESRLTTDWRALCAAISIAPTLNDDGLFRAFFCDPAGQA